MSLMPKETTLILNGSMVYISVLRDSALLNYALAGVLSGLSSMVQYQVSKEHSLSYSG